MRRPASLPALLLLAVLPSLPLRAQEAPPDAGADKTMSPYFLVESGDTEHDGFPLKETRVEAAVSGTIAEVKVTQVYANSGKVPLNARYVFPASTRAAIHGMTMRIRDEIIEAKIERKAKAQAVFDAAKKEGKGASLMTQKRPNVFTMDVANVMPGDEVKVELRYSELLVPEAGIYEFVFPTVVGPRYTGADGTDLPREKWTHNPYLQEGRPSPMGFQMRVTLDAGVPIQEIAVPSHKADIAFRGPSAADVGLSAEETFPADRDFILRYGLKGKQIESGLLLSKGKDENHFLLMLQPPARVRPDALPGREYVFVVDVSGSMDGFPLETSKGLMGDLVGQLTAKDRFNIVLFAENSAVYAKKSVAADAGNLAAALAWLGNASAGGGTELKAALETALNLPRDMRLSRSLVVITDGYISAEHDVFQLIARSRDRANVFAFGIGTGVNRFLVEGLAKAGMGEPFVVTGPEEAPAVAKKFRDYILWPILTGIKVRFEGFDAYDLEPASLPDLMADRPILVQGKWKGTPKGTIKVTGMTGEGRFEQSLAVGASKPEEKHGVLRYLWARSRIAALSDFNAAPVDGEREEQITELGLAYNLMTQYTSFVAVSTQVQNTEGPAKDVKQPLPLPKHVSKLAVGHMAQVPEPSLWWLLAALAVAGALVYGWRHVPSRYYTTWVIGILASAALAYTLFWLVKPRPASASVPALSVPAAMLAADPGYATAGPHLPGLAAATGKPAELPEPGLAWMAVAVPAGLALFFLVRLLFRRLGSGTRLASLRALQTRLQQRLRLRQALRLRPQAAFLLAALSAFLAVKWHYSTASVSELRWILAPVALLVEAATGAGYRWHAGIGYVTADESTAIVAACAGLNFFLMVFALAAWLRLPRVRTWGQAAGSLAASAAMAFATTLIANALRIWIAMYLYRSQWSWQGLTAEQLHRIEGVLVYFVFLWAIYAASTRRGMKEPAHV